MERCTMSSVNLAGMSYTYTKPLCGPSGRLLPPPEACMWPCPASRCLPTAEWPNPASVSVAWLQHPRREIRMATNDGFRDKFITTCSHTYNGVVKPASLPCSSGIVPARRRCCGESGAMAHVDGEGSTLLTVVARWCIKPDKIARAYVWFRQSELGLAGQVIGPIAGTVATPTTKRSLCIITEIILKNVGQI